MITILSFCTMPWWLAWLLPFLLGLLIAWAWMSRYKTKIEELEGQNANLRNQLAALEADLTTCQSRRTEIESDLALTKGRMREMEAELKELQKNTTNPSDSGGVALTAGVIGSDEDVVIEINEEETDETESDQESMGIVAGSGSSGSEVKAIYAKLPPDNLQIIEGIGPKMESVLKENGVNDWATLAGLSTAGVQKILDKYGDRYRIIDPGTWSQQADLANQNKFEELITLQKNLGGGKDNNINQTDSKLEKVMVRLGILKKYKQDDLKAVEGIGPKIAELLHNAGIKTWEELADTSVEKIQEILTEAGPRFSLADPGTWPKQAELAAAGKWSELKEYQDFLQGGK